ncbi:MAG: TatD family hydrolase [Planctomycetota bacterium]|nr:TatD family hydrolase [Planctomycetota bacterium]
MLVRDDFLIVVPMRICEPHAHMCARTTHDYEAMAKAGIEVIVEPAFWLGETRKYPGSFFDYFDHLIGYEHKRAATYGIRQYVTIAMNPKEANDRDLGKAVVDELPRFLEVDHVVAVGEIGFDAISEAEEESFVRQVELAREFGLPLLIHSPHVNKYEGIQKLLEVLGHLDFPMEKVLMDHNTEETTEMSLSAGAWAGHTVYPISKISPERMANIVEKHGIERMMINSAADWGPSDPLMVPYTIEELRRRGVVEEDIQKLVWDNPMSFFSQSGRIS